MNPEPDFKLVETGESRIPEQRVDLTKLIHDLLEQLITLGETAKQMRYAIDGNNQQDDKMAKLSYKLGQREQPENRKEVEHLKRHVSGR